MLTRFLALAAFLLAPALPAQADARRVDLGDMDFAATVELAVQGPDGLYRFTADELEALGTYRIETATPWREVPAVFDGVLLADILARAGLAERDSVRIVAENDYAVIVPQEVWATHGALLATRVDGRPHSRRARGPLQIVFDMQARPDTGLASFEGNWVWMVAWIGPPD